MDFSDQRAVRILWSSFSDTLPSMIQCREEFDAACSNKNIEVIHWCQGEKMEATLHYFLPMRYAHSSGKNTSVWTSAYQKRFPDLADINSVVAYVTDNFNLLCEVFKPDIFISWNRYDPIFGLPFKLAENRGLATFDMERALVPHLVSLGLDFRRSKKEISTDFIAKGRALLLEYPTAHIRKQRGIRFKVPYRQKKSVLVLGSWDAVMDNSASFYRDSLQMATRVAQSLGGWKVIFKPHPLATANEHHAHNFEISNANPTKLIADSDVVITFGTKLELDVVQQGKPLILCGGGFLASSGAGCLTQSHETTIAAVNTIDTWHHPEKAADALTAFVGHEATQSWYSLTNRGKEAQKLDDLLDRFLEVETTGVGRPDLYACMLKYHAEFVNRYHRSGIGDFSNREVAKELSKRIKLKLRRRI